MVDVDELFSLPLEDFTAARDALAKQLKKDGDADAAAEVKALRKPTVSAWAVNQAVRQAPDAADELVDAAAELRAAQTAAVEGGDGRSLRDAMKAHRAAVARMLDEVRGVGVTAAAQLERATATLQATASSPAAAEAVREARLTNDLDPSGFGDAGGLSLVDAKGERGTSSGGSPSDAATGAAKAQGRPVPGSRKTSAADDSPASDGTADRRSAKAGGSADRSGGTAGGSADRSGGTADGSADRSGGTADGSGTADPSGGRAEERARRKREEAEERARRKREEAEERAAELGREADEAETEAGLAEAEAERLAEEADELEAQAKEARRAATEARHAAVEARSAADGARRRADKATEKAARR